MRCLAAAAAVCLALPALACGEGDADEARQGDRAGARGHASVEPTAGRLGDATVAGRRQDARTLSRGGRLDPARRPDAARAEGVAEGAGCAMRERIPVAGDLAGTARSVLCLLNAQRSARGLPSLRADAELARAASMHARAMVDRRFFEHTAPDGSTVVSRVRSTRYLDGAAEWMVGENLAWGTGALATPAAILVSWMNSAGHRANILRARFNDVGVSVFLGNPARRDGAGGTYVTVFGQRTPAGGRGGATAGAGTAADPAQPGARRRRCRKGSRKQRARCRARRAERRR